MKRLQNYAVDRQTQVNSPVAWYRVLGKFLLKCRFDEVEKL